MCVYICMHTYVYVAYAQNGFACSWTALHWAADKGYEGIARCLIKCGAQLDVKDKFGNVAAVYADEEG